MAVLNAKRPLRARVGRWLAAWCFAWCAFVPAASAQPAALREYQIKAAFLFNFVQFVEWPPATFSIPHAPLVIGILGSDPFGAAIDEMVASEVVNGRPLVVQRYRRAEDIKTCHLLFISQSEAPRLEEIFSSLKGRSVLTVGDLEGFARRGGMIRFTSENGKIRMRINLEAARDASLTISSKLLRSAVIVAPGRD